MRLGYELGEVKAMTFTTLIVANIMTILTNLSWSESIFNIFRIPNPAIKWIVGGTILFMSLILNIPFLQKLFQFSPVSISELIVVSVVGISTIIWFELYKHFKHDLTS